jgi:hypothetical protein
VAQFQVTRAYARFMALEAQVAVLRGNKLEPDLLESFIKIFDCIKSASLQDFNVESLLVALEFSGRADDARRIATEYLTKHRRDSCAPWHDLRRVIDRILPVQSATNP